MTTDEAIKHIFHPKIVKHLKRHAKPMVKSLQEKGNRVATLCQVYNRLRVWGGVGLSINEESLRSRGGQFPVSFEP